MRMQVCTVRSFIMEIYCVLRRRLHLCAGQVPLLPKPTPSSQLPTFALVPLQPSAHNCTNLHIVAAEPTSVHLLQDGNLHAFVAGL